MKQTIYNKPSRPPPLVIIPIADHDLVFDKTKVGKKILNMTAKQYISMIDVMYASSEDNLDPLNNYFRTGKLEEDSIDDSALTRKLVSFCEGDPTVITQMSDWETHYNGKCLSEARKTMTNEQIIKSFRKEEDLKTQFVEGNLPQAFYERFVEVAWPDLAPLFKQ